MVEEVVGSMTTTANKSVERMGISRSAQMQSRHQWRLIPVAHLTFDRFNITRIIIPDVRHKL